MKKINVITLGCSKNTVDSEHLMAQLAAAGYEVRFDSDRTDARTVVINTCGFIGERVKHAFAGTPVFDQTGLLENAQLVRDGGNGHSAHLSDVADTQLCLKLNVENAQACAVPENLVEVCQRKQSIVAWHGTAGAVNQIGVELMIFAMRCILHDGSPFLNT